MTPARDGAGIGVMNEGVYWLSGAATVVISTSYDVLVLHHQIKTLGLEFETYLDTGDFTIDQEDNIDKFHVPIHIYE